jgi:DNA-binding transcriptional ArsR family regulator
MIELTPLILSAPPSIARLKFAWSQRNCRDVGTPWTVDVVLALADIQRRNLLSALGDRPYLESEVEFGEALLRAQQLPNREQLILAYFSHKPLIGDEHGRTQLDGELRRFVAKEDGVDPRNCLPDQRTLGNYSIIHRFSEELIGKLRNLFYEQ